MLFNSYQYLLFLPTVVFLFFQTPYRFRWVLLLVASCVFYMAFVPKYILILFAVILIDYFTGLALENAPSSQRKRLLAVSLTANLSILVFFKFFNFAADNVASLITLLGLPLTIPHLNFILPIGLSFHVFQSLSYALEVYYGRQRAETHLGRFAVYVLFFPQMVAGPIERPQNLLHQFTDHYDFHLPDFVLGMRLILLGLFKKIVIADPLALFCDPIFNKPSPDAGFLNLMATLAFTLQIYFDFSGYSDIALGSARLLGFRLMRNFANPYTACSLREFWTRWHISLSTWFKDYVYVPLGGNRVRLPRQCFNLVVVFALSGLWHGADWKFMLWGLIHALGLVATILVTKVVGGRFPLPRKLKNALGWLLTLAYVSFAWVFFRANNTSDALTMLQSIVSLARHPSQFGFNGYFPARAMLAAMMGAVTIGMFEPREMNSRSLITLDRLAPPLRLAAYAVAILMILNLGVTSDMAFIYFQF